jgi:transposase InsO family protein
MDWIQLIFIVARSIVRNQTELAAENLAIRQQLAVLQRQSKRPKLKNRERIFWVWLSRFWSNWKSVLVIVQPDTVVRWHRQGFKLYWRWKSKSKKTGRPQVWREIRELVRLMCLENPTWGAPRIHSELQLLGYDVSETTVGNYMVRDRKPPSQTWRSFLDNHLQDIVAIDFFSVPTATFRILFAFVVLQHDRRMVVHFNVTANPTAVWTSQQIVEAFPEKQHPRFLLRDRDGIYGKYFKQRVANMGIEEVITAPRSPWQNPYVERLIGSIRRECLNHVIVLNERHLKRILNSYFDYYNHSRTHLSLNRNSPFERDVEVIDQGKVISIPQVGGLHHRYRRAA